MWARPARDGAAAARPGRAAAMITFTEAVMDGWMRVIEKGIKESTAQTGEFFVSHRSV